MECKMFASRAILRIDMDSEERDLRQGNAHVLLTKDWNDWFDHRVAMLRAKYDEAREDYQEVFSDDNALYSDEDRLRARELLDNVDFNEEYLNQAVAIIDVLRATNNPNRQRANEADNMMRDLERLGATDRLGGGEIVEVPPAPQFDFNSNGREHSDSSEHSRYIDEIGLSRDHTTDHSSERHSHQMDLRVDGPSGSRGHLITPWYERQEVRSVLSQEAKKAESQSTDDDASEDLLEDVSPLDSPSDEDDS
ncbi:uncharacterized protein LOC111265758 [Varroa jacobsoni]|uniref:uncharacterized protein LOC111265758 n=1 Tax=Varroa jacobsoni TaxID=62625 RepID=UPI000BF78A65|nr:uncharacterized protein LOC111265758 [Varroa jacobsoni]XP_022698404.1 uncharacterized protein LOC111265758 [Varroa jacobsoni]XP_022698405.1 uncharacterized protein LOC111265758 [Varroa jacobsoni]XP_022698406.1 uncharacterized protein LOC111265758 [Varroa jacobsoni]